MEVATRDEWVKVGGLKIRFQRAGCGPAILLVHGLLGYSFSWRFAVPLLAEHREVFALDMPGSGFSDCDAEMNCRLKSAAERLLEFMDAVGIRSCDLIGSSYGGSTALLAAASSPTRVRSLVLVSPANPWSRTGRKRLTLLSLPGIGSIFPMLARPLGPFDIFFIRRMYGNPMRMTSETVRGYRAVLARPGILEHAVKILQTWRADMDDLVAAASKLQSIPMMLVWGSKDRVVDLASAEILGKHAQVRKISVIQGAGHLPYEEEPEQFSRIVLDFLAQYSPLNRSGREVT